MESNDVVIVGAGIGGAVLALALGSRGWKVTLLEREIAPQRMARPEVLWGATPAALDRYGLGEAIRDTASVRVQGVRFTRGDRPLLTLTPEVLKRAKVEAYSTDPNKTRELIADAAAATGNVRVLRGVQVERVERNGNGPVRVVGRRADAELEEQCRLVVGDDGAHSVVRTAIESAIELKVFPVDFLTAGIIWPEDLPHDWARVWLNPAALRQGIPGVGCLPWPGGRGVLMLPLPHERAERMMQEGGEQFWQALEKTTPLSAHFAAQLRFPENFKLVRRPYGHVARYVTDNIAILGDAAHPVSPAGGQGANAAIWDALALAEVAHEGLAAGDLSRERLARYEALRHPRNSDSVAITQVVARVFRGAGYVPGLPWIAPALLRFADAIPALKSYVIHRFGTTFVTR